MNNIKDKIDSLDQHIASWMYKYGMLVLRISLAVVFIWFAAFKRQLNWNK